MHGTQQGKTRRRDFCTQWLVQKKPEPRTVPKRPHRKLQRTRKGEVGIHIGTGGGGEGYGKDGLGETGEGEMKGHIYGGTKI